MAVAEISEIDERPIRGSFRDPAGFVFRAGGVVRRHVNATYQSHYDHLMRSGLYGALTSRGLLVPHAEVEGQNRNRARAYKVLQPELISFISYPYEWCFGQLKDAALAVLTIQQIALEHGMSLKDCSAYNLQFKACRPVFIDTLSFERYEEGRPWVGYQQFCRHFLAPLALMSLVDVRLGQLLRIHVDGVPLELAGRVLPFRTFLSPALLLHVHLHARAQKAFTGDVASRRSRPVSRTAQLGLLDNLRGAVERLNWNPRGTVWADYDQHTNYAPDARRHKEDLVLEFLGAVRPRTVWDLGANAGRHSRAAAKLGADIVAFDADFGATEFNYRACRSEGERRVLPLVVDLSNPSPALGWAHEERLAWMERGPVDAVLALALVHHLAIANNVPLDRIAELLHRIGRYVVVEFVPKEDSQVQRLLANRADVFPDYSQAGFERAFETRFRIRRSVAIRDSRRVLYLLEGRPTS